MAELRVDVAHSARIYDYVLDGKTNYPPDREAAELLMAAFPNTRTAARQNRAFLHRASRFLAERKGIDQFLDIGTGIPTSPNLHEVVQAVRPASRVVYVDNDPIVLAHARALLTSSAEGRTAYLDADLNRPADILTSPVLSGTLDLSRPVALSLLAVLHFLPDAAQPGALIERLMAELPTGSYLVISHATDDRSTPDATQRLVDLYGKQQISIQMRSRDEVAALVPAGMELVEPGITFLHRWHPDSEADQYADDDAPLYGLIARKL
ncbi:SAM-dependent methyltransferase [Pseudofrankia inefficax]|uniref:Methyltransferase n=1 Tax=Pseudofrankia inefficax (strain DSM 45817 / CECT 9037 / DDB 130130 / EuI1c) TaxID=298654 RepID=E3IZD8_PSEI1|nr:SAM-dependent methyltransferase [Pseudofrankia inefficax]ADP82708.1 protein of unknown function DUF574 [Pseudofrankia inefficax]